MQTNFSNLESFRNRYRASTFGTQNAQRPNRAVYTTDSVEISAKPKMSTTKKVIIGTGIATAAALAGIMAIGARRVDYIAKAQKTFQETFMRNDISREETINLLKEYKEIYKINDKETFINTLFENAKKNYGLSHLNFRIEKVDLPKSKVASMRPDGTFTVNKNLDLDKDSLINIVFHEFRHAKQNELMCSKDPIKYASGIFQRSKDMIKQKDEVWCNKMREAARNTASGKTLSEKEIEDIVDFQLEQKWSQLLKVNVIDKLGLGHSTVPEELSEYLEKCFKAHSNYNDANVFAYHFNFLEKDARKAGKGMQRIITSIPDKLV